MIDAAIILAGGKGSRLAPWPAPKCLMPVNGVSILRRIIDHVRPHVKRIIVCTGYRGDDVKAAARDLGVEFSDAGVDATMGIRLMRAKVERSVEGRALILYGDELVDVDVPDLLAKHKDQIPNALTFVASPHKLPFGLVRGNQIEDCTVLVNVGFAIVEPLCWSVLRTDDGLADWINRIPDRRCVIHTGRRATVNSLLDLENAEEVWR